MNCSVKFISTVLLSVSSVCPSFTIPFVVLTRRVFQRWNVGPQKTKVMDRGGDSERVDGRQKGRMMIRRGRERKRERDVQTAARRKRGIVLAEKARKLLT